MPTPCTWILRLLVPTPVPGSCDCWCPPLYLDPVIVGVRHDDLLLDSEAEAVRRVELTLARTQGTELAADLHSIQLNKQNTVMYRIRKIRYRTGTYKSVLRDQSHFGADPDPQIRTSDRWIRIRLLSSVTLRMQKENIFIPDFFL